jgi:SAM-dependent methyltransferase
MNWLVKSAILQTLSRVPIGTRLYRVLQETTGSARLDMGTYWPPRSKLFQLMVDNGVSFQGRRVLEIGTGWHPVLPLVFYLVGAAEVITLDLNPWLTQPSLLETFEKVLTILPQLPLSWVADGAAGMEQRAQQLQAVLAQAQSDRSRSVRDLLSLLHIQYWCPADAARLPVGDGDLDCVVHSDVFEHIPPSVIVAVLAESHRVIKAGGIHAARIIPGDHFAEMGDITAVNFLRYSPRYWHWLGGSGLAYHNRLRGVDYLNHFEAAGFEILIYLPEVDEVAQQALQERRVKPSAEFAAYSTEQLACSRIYVIGRKHQSLEKT